MEEVLVIRSGKSPVRLLLGVGGRGLKACQMQIKEYTMAAKDYTKECAEHGKQNGCSVELKKCS